MTSTDDLRSKVYNGTKVTAKAWIEARRQESEAETDATLEAEHASLVAEGESLAAQRKLADQLHADLQAFNDKNLEPLRDAYADYMAARQTLVNGLQHYVEDRHPLAVRCAQAGPGFEPPADLNQWAYLNLADRECQGEPILPHVLHRQG